MHERVGAGEGEEEADCDSAPVGDADVVGAGEGEEVDDGLGVCDNVDA